jgi:hypothetical protein
MFSMSKSESNLREAIRLANVQREQIKRLQSLQAHRTTTSSPGEPTDLAVPPTEGQLPDRQKQNADLKLEKSKAAPQAVNSSCVRGIDMGLKRKNVAFLREIFDRHKGEGGGLSTANLAQALSDADAPVIPDSEEAVAEWISRFDADANALIGFEEFRSGVFAPDELHLWYQEMSMPMMADALRPLVGRGSDQLLRVSRLSEAEMRAAWSAVCSRIPDHAEAMHKLLRQQFETQSDFEHQTQLEMNSGKFAIQKMACGTIDEFHEGLQARVGTPHLNFEVAMWREHCQKPGWDKEFITSNYNIRTTPKQEWMYIVGDETGNRLPCPAADRGHGRRIVPISELLQLPLSKAANLIRAEMIAIVMYSGPMFVVYNAILRRFPPDVYQTFEQGKNTYSTTIYVLVSAVQKLSRCTHIPEGTLLYRGLGGLLDLPDTFHQLDRYGRSGYTDWGFMSTTADREIALGYSGVKQRRPKAMVMVIQASSVDRGACISEFSQYPGEREYLWLPCSFVQRVQLGPGRVEMVEGGLVTLYSVRVNLNLKSETVEELLEKKRTTHLAGARAMVDEVRFELEEWVESPAALERIERDLQDHARFNSSHDGVTFSPKTLAAKIVEQCEEVVQRHEDAPVSEYVDDASFRWLVSEVLDTKVWAMEKKMQYLEDKSQSICYLQNYELLASHRGWTALLKSRISCAAAGSGELVKASTQLLLSEGLVKSGEQGKTDARGESMLVQAGADGWTAPSIAAAVAMGADVNATNDTGCTGVWLAACYGHDAALAALLDARGDANMCNKTGTSPIWIAAQQGQDKCLSRLIASGGDVNKCITNARDPAYNGTSPIDVARQKGHSECVRLLELALGPV